MREVRIGQEAVVPTPWHGLTRKLAEFSTSMRRTVFFSPLGDPIGWVSAKYYGYDTPFLETIDSIEKNRIFATKHLLNGRSLHGVSWRQYLSSAMENSQPLIVDMLLSPEICPSISDKKDNIVKAILGGGRIHKDMLRYFLAHPRIQGLDINQCNKIAESLVISVQADDVTLGLLKTLGKSSSNPQFLHLDSNALLSWAIARHKTKVVDYLLSLPEVNEVIAQEQQEEKIINDFYRSLLDLEQWNENAKALFLRLVQMPEVKAFVQREFLRVPSDISDDIFSNLLKVAAENITLSNQQILRALEILVQQDNLDAFLSFKNMTWVQDAIGSDTEGALLKSLNTCPLFTRGMAVQWPQAYDYLLNFDSIKQALTMNPADFLTHAVNRGSPSAVEKLASLECVKNYFIRSIATSEEDKQNSALVRLAASRHHPAAEKISNLIVQLAVDEDTPGFRETALMALREAESSGLDANVQALRNNIRCVDDFLTLREAEELAHDIQAVAEEGRVLRHRRNRTLETASIDPEGAYHFDPGALSGDIQSAYDRMYATYIESYITFGQQALLGQIERYLREQYEKDPVTYQGKALPLEYDSNIYKNENGKKKSPRERKEINTAYHSHQVHTAYRYLFAKPNLWMSRGAKRAYIVAMGDGSGFYSKISNDSIEKICFLWLAARSEPLPESTNRDDVKMSFVGMLQDRGRSNNFDPNTQREDMAIGDKPDCDLGVGSSIRQFLMMLQGDEAILDPSILCDRFTAHFVSSNKHKTGVIDKIEALSADALNTFNGVVQKVVIEQEHIEDNAIISEPQRTLFNRVLGICTEEVEAFKAHCFTAFGNKMRRNVLWQGSYYSSYDKFIEHLAKNLLQEHYTPISITLKERLKTRCDGSGQSEVSSENKAPLITPMRESRRRSARLQQRCERPSTHQDEIRHSPRVG